MAELEKVYADNKFLAKRLIWTIDFVHEHAPPKSRILDLGPRNIISKKLQHIGYEVENAYSHDLDDDFDCVRQEGFDVFTSFEVFEHLVSPLPLIKAVKAPKMIASIPLSLWFAKSYRGNLQEDSFDEHYHEFEPWQFKLLLRKGGWKIDAVEFHTSYDPKAIGIRPILRRFYPRYMVVAASRI